MHCHDNTEELNVHCLREAGSRYFLACFKYYCMPQFFPWCGGGGGGGGLFTTTKRSYDGVEIPLMACKKDLLTQKETERQKNLEAN